MNRFQLVGWSLIACMCVVGCSSGEVTREHCGEGASCATAPIDSTMSSTSSVEITSTMSVAPTSEMACSGSVLKATAMPLGDGAMGNTRLVVQVKNVGHRPCQLQATPPTLAGIGPDGTVTRFATPGDGTYFGEPLPGVGVLASGAVAEVWVGGATAGGCTANNAPQVWPSMLLGLADGTTIAFTTDFDTGCGVSVTPFGTPSV